MLDAVTTGLTTVIGWIGTVVTSVTSGALKDLLPLFAIGIAISDSLHTKKYYRYSYTYSKQRK